MKTKNIEQGTIINGVEFMRELPHVEHPSRRSRFAEFRCYCGKIFNCYLASVVSGNTKSCGCYGASSRSDRFRKHGMSKEPIYKIWKGIKTRCYNKNRGDYKYYGGCGIVMSEEFHDFKTWMDYVASLPGYATRAEDKLTIDRIDVTKNYERGNLRWATRKQQSLNQRRNSGLS